MKIGNHWRPTGGWALRAARSPAMLAAALALVGFAVVPARAGDPRPRFWDGVATAQAINLSFNTEPALLPLEDFVHTAAPDASTTWSKGAAVARASVLYPGSSGTGGPRLLCEFGFPCPPGFPPDYPLTAQAQHPTTPEASAAGGLARARAHADGVEATARGGATLDALLDPLAAAVQVRSSSAVSRQSFDAGALVVTATSELADVALLGGLVRIESVASSARAVSEPGVAPRSSASLTLEGVTVAGQPAEITAEGIRVLGHDAGGAVVDEARRLLEAALSSLAADIRLVGTSEASGGRTARAEAAGVLVTFRMPVTGPSPPGLPGTPYRTYVTTALLGGAGTVAYASNEGFDLPTAPDSGGTFTAPPDGDLAMPSPPAPPPPKPAPEPAGRPGGLAAPASTGEAEPAGGGPLRRALRLLGGEAADGVTLLYLGAAAACALVFSASRLVAAPGTVGAARGRMER